MMKKILLVLLLSLLLSSPAWATNWCNDANIGGCWNIETGSGTSLVDQSSNSNDGTFVGIGEPTWSSTVPQSTDDFNGTSTYSVDYAGDNDKIDVGSDSSIATSVITYVAWVKTDGSTRIDDIRTVIGSSTSDNGFQLRIDADEKITLNKQNLAAIGTSTSAITNNVWVHVSVTYSSPNYYFYIDGSAAGNGSSTQTISHNSIFIGNRAYVNAPYYIEMYAGLLDEVAIFSDVKDSTDINDIMDNGLVQTSAQRIPTMLELRGVTVY